MKVLIIYKSKTGFTKWYAEFIAKEVGGTPNEATKEIDVVWKSNLSEEELQTIPHFYMQGGICYEKMSFSNRTIMKLMSKVLDKKRDKDSTEEGFSQAIKSSYDIKAKEYAEPLIKCLLEG